MPRCGLKTSVLHGHLGTVTCLFCICYFDGNEQKLRGVAALISLSLSDLAAVFIKNKTFTFSKPSPSALEKCSLLRAMPPTSECLCPLTRKGLQIMLGMHFLKHTTSYCTVFLSKVAGELVSSICHSCHGGHVF